MERATVNEQLFKDGKSLGWLTSILRTEIFAHGRFGDQKKPPENWMLPEAEFNQACELMMARYAAMSMQEILATPRPIHILFAWNQAGDEDGPRALVAASTTTDPELVEVLHKFIRYVDSSDRGRYAVLSKDSVGHFLDFDAAHQRLESIATNGPSDLRDTAKKLLAAAADGRRF